MATKKDALAGNNLLIVLVLVSLLVVGVTALVGKTLLVSILLNQKVVVAKEAANTQLDTNLTSAPKLVQEYRSMSNVKDVLASALPTSSDLPALLVTYENIAAQAGVKIKSIGAGVGSPTVALPSAAPASGSTAAIPQVYDFSFTFTGTFASLNGLFKAMELSARPMRITSMSLSGSGAALSGDVSVETYFQDAAILPLGKVTIK